MKIIKINATNSTNSFLKELAQNSSLDEITVAVTNNQTSGRGQMNNSWLSEPYKNLTFSLFTPLKKIKIEHQAYLNFAVSLAIYDTLLEYNVPDLYIKWPNDILSENRKLCGVLIENLYRGTQLQGSIVGIGLNVNQEDFSTFPRASSMRLCSGVQFKVKEVLDTLLQEIERLLNQNESFAAVLEKYNARLFGRNESRLFRKHGKEFNASVVAVNQEGYLELIDTNGIHSKHQLKEIEWVY